MNFSCQKLIIQQRVQHVNFPGKNTNRKQEKKIGTSTQRKPCMNNEGKFLKNEFKM